MKKILYVFVFLMLVMSVSSFSLHDLLLSYGLKKSSAVLDSPSFDITIINMTDYTLNKSIILNMTINTTTFKDYDVACYFSGGNSEIYSTKIIFLEEGFNTFFLVFDSEKVKKTHHKGNFVLKYCYFDGQKVLFDYNTSFYNFEDFADDSYIKDSSYYFLYSGQKVEEIIFNTTFNITSEGDYTFEGVLSDFTGTLIKKFSKTKYLPVGLNDINFDISCSFLYERKKEGPFLIRSLNLVKDSIIYDSLKKGEVTDILNLDNFSRPALPELITHIEFSDDYLHGDTFIDINLTIYNFGEEDAYDFFVFLFDNSSYEKEEPILLLKKNSSKTFSYHLNHIDDSSFMSYIDFYSDVVEENESNNIFKKKIKINKIPLLISYYPSNTNNITIGEGDRLRFNASFIDDSNLSYVWRIENNTVSTTGSFLFLTNYSYSGNYTITLDVTDGYLNSSLSWHVNVLDTLDYDFDGDGVDDSVDRLIGDNTSVNSSKPLRLRVGGYTNLSMIFNKTKKIEFIGCNRSILEFEWNFSKSSLNLSMIDFILFEPDNFSYSYSIIKGLVLDDNKTKNITIDKRNITMNSVCIFDAEISSISSFSSTCNSANETLVICDNSTSNSYSCYDYGTYLKITGLRHSGVRQFLFSSSSSSNTQDLSYSASTQASSRSFSTELTKDNSPPIFKKIKNTRPILDNNSVELKNNVKEQNFIQDTSTSSLSDITGNVIGTSDKGTNSIYGFLIILGFICTGFIYFITQKIQRFK